jgi:hypothetical protein
MRLGVVNTTGCGFGWKWHGDSSVEDVLTRGPAIGEADVVVIMCKSPISAEICPMLTDELRPGMGFTKVMLHGIFSGRSGGQLRLGQCVLSSALSLDAVNDRRRLPNFDHSGDEPSLEPIAPLPDRRVADQVVQFIRVIFEVVEM